MVVGQQLFVAEVSAARERIPGDAEWSALAANALEPNPFFESWALREALASFGKDDVLLMTIRRQPADGSPGELVGLLPLRRKRMRGIGPTLLESWIHPECYLGVPLVDRRDAVPIVAAMIAALTTSTLARLHMLYSDGPVAQLLMREAEHTRVETVAVGRYSRAFCDTRAAHDANAYVEANISHKHRKEIRRQTSRLRDLGAVAVVEAKSAEDMQHWIAEFTALEHAGWKGQESASVSSSGLVQNYFNALCEAAWNAGRLQLLTLRCANRTVAMKCNLIAFPGAFAYKITYDEAYAKYSPGTLLELANLERLYALAPHICWMDSCASRRRFLVDRMWGQRRSMETLLLARSASVHALIAHLFPLVIWLRNRFRRKYDEHNDHESRSRSAV